MGQMEDIARSLAAQGKEREVKALADSAEARALDPLLHSEDAKLAQSGDSAALQRLLGAVLSTADGKKLVENVKNMMGK